MYYVYLIQSDKYPERRYVGFTTSLEQRLSCHNTGGSVHTAKYRPWKLVVYLGLENKEQALLFEKYLKSQSGRAFAKKRLW